MYICLITPSISAYSAAWSAPVSRLTSSYTPLDQHLISFAISIYWAMRSSPQPHDLCLLNPAITAYSAVRYVPDIRLRSTVTRLISDNQPLNSKGTWGAVLRDPSKTEFILLPPSSRLSVVLHLGYHLYPHNSLLVLNLMTWCLHQPCNLPFSWLLTDALPALLPCLDSP